VPDENEHVVGPNLRLRLAWDIRKCLHEQGDESVIDDDVVTLKTSNRLAVASNRIG